MQLLKQLESNFFIESEIKCNTKFLNYLKLNDLKSNLIHAINYFTFKYIFLKLNRFIILTHYNHAGLTYSKNNLSIVYDISIFNWFDNNTISYIHIQIYLDEFKSGIYITKHNIQLLRLYSSKYYFGGNRSSWCIYRYSYASLPLNTAAHSAHG